MTTLNTQIRSVPKIYRNKRIYQGRAAATTILGSGQVPAGGTYIAGDGIDITASVVALDKNFVEVAAGAGVKLKHNNNIKLEITAAGATVTGTFTVTSHIYQGDDDCHYFGNGGRIVHNGTDFYIQSFLHGGRILFQGEDADEVNRALIYADPDSDVKIYYAGVEKFATASTGIKIPGINSTLVFPLGWAKIETEAATLYLNYDNAQNVYIGGGAGNAVRAQFIPNAAVNLFYNGSKKIGTVTGGIEVTGGAKHPSFTSGFQGTNWQITVGGDAEFRNVLISGGLSVYELILNRLHYQCGGLIIGAGGGKIKTIHVSTPGSEQLEFEDPEGNSILPFTVGAIVMVQDFDLNRTTVIKKIVRQVASISSQILTLTTTTGWTTGDDTGAFAFGDEVVAIGHVSNAALDASIYMSAVDSDNPFLRVFDGVSSYNKWSLGDKTTIKLQLGNLESLASYDIVPASPGYGLYSNNVYLTGKIVATSGNIGGWTIDQDAIYTGTKKITDGYTTSGITLGSNGSFHAPNFYIDTDGDVGFRAKEIIYTYKGVSDTVILSHDDIAGTVSKTYVIVKTITLGPYIKDSKELRIYFEIKVSDDLYSAVCQIYRNTTPVSAEIANGTESWVDYSLDIAGWQANDEINFKLKITGGTIETAQVRFLRVCGDMAVQVNEVTGENTFP